MLSNVMEEILLTEEQIQGACKKLGETITNDYNGKDLVLLGLLKGCVPFLSDLSKHIDLPVEIQYMVVSSYHGGTSSGELKIKYDLEKSILNRDILIVEDIVDSGQTITTVTELLKSRGAKSVEVVSLLNKPSNNTLSPKYVGFEIPNKFVIGYGLDFDEKYRNIPYIGVLKKEYYEK